MVGIVNCTLPDRHPSDRVLGRKRNLLFPGAVI